MGTTELRAALAQGDGTAPLQIDELTLHQVGGKQVVAVRGRRADGSAFAVTSEPFDGDPIAQMRVMGLSLATRAAAAAVATVTSPPVPPGAAAQAQPNRPEVTMADAPTVPAAAPPKGPPEQHFTGLVSGLRANVRAAVGNAAALKARGASSLGAFATASQALNAVYDEVDAATAEINGTLIGDGSNGVPLEDVAKNSAAPSPTPAPGSSNG